MAADTTDKKPARKGTLIAFRVGPITAKSLGQAALDLRHGTQSQMLRDAIEKVLRKHGYPTD